MSELCKYCGQKYNDLRSLVLNSCLHNPNGRRHEPYEERIGGDFTCKFCGRTFKDIRSMVLNSSLKNPTRGGKHSPAR